MDSSQNTDLSVLQYLSVARRRKWLIVLAVVLSVLTSILLSWRATRVYAANADVLLTASVDESPFSDDGRLTLDPTLVETQVQVLKSRPVVEEARDRLGSKASKLSGIVVEQIGRTKVLRVRVESSSPAVAAEAANTFAEVYVEQRRTAAIDSALEVAKQLLQKAQEAKTQLEQLDARIAAVKGGRIPNPAELQNLETQRNAAANQYTAFQEKYDQVQVDAQLRRGGVEVLARAAVPSTPFSPAPVRNAVLALLLGLLVGVGGAFAVEFLDDTVRSTDDVDRHARGVPILATIPAVTEWKNREKTKLISVEDPTSTGSEAYRSLRTSLQFIGLRRPLRTILVTSPMASEGKTTTLANLAVTLARAGRRVVCVDCDLRRPRLNEFFGRPNSIGFTSVLLGDQPLSSALQTVAEIAGGSLRLLASGPLPPNPAELLGTARATELLAALAAEADFVLLDAPPLLPITDAVVLSSQADGVLLVATSQVTSRRHLSRAVDLLQQAEADTIGIVLNGVGSEAGYGYGYKYRYHSEGHPQRESQLVAEPAASAPRRT